MVPGLHHMPAEPELDLAFGAHHTVLPCDSDVRPGPFGCAAATAGSRPLLPAQCWVYAATRPVGRSLGHAGFSVARAGGATIPCP